MKPTHIAALGVFTDTYGSQWTASLGMTDQPVVTLMREDACAPDTYNLTQFMSVAARVTPFRVAPGFPDEPVRTFDAQTANAIAMAAIGLVSSEHGRFELRWVPNDPKVPF